MSKTQKEIKLYRNRGGSWREALVYDKADLPENDTYWIYAHPRDWQNFDSQPIEFKEKVLSEIDSKGFYYISFEDEKFIKNPVEPVYAVGSPEWNKKSWKWAIAILFCSIITALIADRYFYLLPEVLMYPITFIVALSWFGIFGGGIMLLVIIGAIIINGIKYSFKDE